MINKKQIQLFFIISIVLNIVFLWYGSIKILKMYSQHKSEQKIIAKIDSVTFFLNRNEVFSKLPDDSNEVIMLGNSLTHNFEWHEIFKNVNIKSRGINSDITKGVLIRLDDVIKNKPKKIFLEIGVNDLIKGFPVDTVFYNYQKIIQAINQKSPETKIYIQNLFPTSRMIDNTNKPVIDSIYILNKKLEDFSKLKKLTYIDLFSTFLTDNKLNPNYDCGDNLHLSGAGYLAWCNLIKEYINE